MKLDIAVFNFKDKSEELKLIEENIKEIVFIEDEKDFWVQYWILQWLKEISGAYMFSPQIVLTTGKRIFDVLLAPAPDCPFSRLAVFLYDLETDSYKIELEIKSGGRYKFFIKNSLFQEAAPD